MNTLPEDASIPPTPTTPTLVKPHQAHRPTVQHYRRNIKIPCFQQIVRVKIHLAVIAPISIQVIVERIELLTARQTILTITIIVDSLRHITKRSTRIKNNLIVVLTRNKSAISSHLFLTELPGAEEIGSGSEGTYVVANHKLRICSAGQRCTNARSSREVA